MSRPIVFRLSDDLEAQLALFMEERGVGKSVVLREAVSDYLDRESLRKERDEMESRIAATMSRVQSEVRASRNEGHVLMAMLDSFIRSYLFHTPPVPEDAHPAQAVSAEQRYRKILDQVPLTLNNGEGLAAFIKPSDDVPMP